MVRVMNQTKIIMASVLGACSVIAAEPEAREWKSAGGTLIRYRWSVPGTIETGKTYPLVLFLHGAGERGTDNAAQLKHGVKPIIEGTAKLGQPCFLIAPQCPPDQWWAPINRATKKTSGQDKPDSLLDGLLALAAELSKAHPVDPKRFYVTGLSMGGYATWDLLGRAPDRIAAAIPICGGGDPAQAEKFANVPIWAFHGEADPVVPVGKTSSMIAALEKAGGKPKSTYYPNVQHDSWTKTYANPDVLKWMLDQRGR